MSSWTLVGLFIWASLIVPAAVFIRDRPESIGLQPDGQSSSAHTVGPTTRVREHTWTFQQAARSRTFWLLVVATLAPGTVQTGLVFHQVSYFTSVGLSTELAASVLSIYAVAFAVMTVIVGGVLEKVPERYALIAGLLLLPVAVLWLMFTASPIQAIVYGVLLGNVGGIHSTTSSVLWAAYYGRQNLGSIRGVTLCFFTTRSRALALACSSTTPRRAPRTWPGSPVSQFGLQVCGVSESRTPLTGRPVLGTLQCTVLLYTLAVVKITGMVASTKREVNVGARVRQLRQDRGISVRTLAAKTDFSPSFISQVEHGQASPSIASLERIAGALGVTLVEFFAMDGPASAVVVRVGDQPELTSTWSRALIQALGPVGVGMKLEPIMITLDPGGRSGKYPYTHPGDEFAIVFEGEVILTLGEERHVLRRGDAVTFTSETPHQWENTGGEPARLVVVSTRCSH